MSESIMLKCKLCGIHVEVKLPNSVENIERDLKKHTRECAELGVSIIYNVLSFFDEVFIEQ